jgi:hypothetical protein
LACPQPGSAPRSEPRPRAWPSCEGIIPSRFYFPHLLLGDLVSIAVLPIPIIGLVLLYQDIARTKLNVPEEKLEARAGLLTRPT